MRGVPFFSVSAHCRHCMVCEFIAVPIILTNIGNAWLDVDLSVARAIEQVIKSGVDVPPHQGITDAF
ncbi:hypothetical protein OH492_10875 [Vibrio chagasii]|nr:hypothetical protein [Vibrio chagasii]